MFFYSRRQRVPIAIRTIGMLSRNPNILRTFCRLTYRNLIGVGLEQKCRNGYAAPPARVDINLTRACNLKCKMCCQWPKMIDGSSLYHWNDPENQLKLEDWLNFLDQIKSFSPFLTITGGEIMLHPDFLQFIREVKKRGFVCNLLTNGIMLNRHADFIVEEGVEFVAVSLDGLEEQHDEIRGKVGAFQKTVEGISALVEARRRTGNYGPIITVTFTIQKSNIHVIDKMTSLVLSLGADVLLFQHLIFSSIENVARHNATMNSICSRNPSIQLVPPSIPEGEFIMTDIGPKEIERIESGIRRARSIAGRQLLVSQQPALSSGKMKPYYLDLDYPLKGVCQCLWNSARIMPDGSMMPCLHVVGGNILENTFSEVWNSESMTGFRQIIKTGYLPGCSRCCCSW